MTLVVAHTVPNGIRLAADMRISDDGAARPPTFDSAALKAIIVHPHACVAFAGRPFKAAFDAIRDLDLPRGKTPDIAAVCDHLLGVHRRDHLDLDFLVAAVNPTRLIQIKGGVATQTSVAWIGSHPAFEVFQDAFNDPGALDPTLWNFLAPEYRDQFRVAQAAGAAEMSARWGSVLSDEEAIDLDVAQRSTTAMRVVVDSELKEVGEQAIFVVGGGRIDEFRYLVRSEARTGRARPEDEKLSGVRPFRSGSAEHGDFAYTTLAPREAGVGAVGIYFVEGRLGLLYHPLKFDVPEKYVEIGLGDFKRAVVKEHGFHLEGIGIGASDAFD